MRFRSIATCALLLLTGCTHRVLMRSMVHQASTVMDIEYQMVLDNIAMFECNPSALPWHVRINDGVVQVNDEAGLAGLGVQWGSSPNFTRGPQANRSITEQWGADAVTNPRIVKKLQDVYREVIGLPPEPDPDYFRYAELLQSNKTKEAKNEADKADGPEEIPPGKIASGQDEQQRSLSPEIEVPTGWFHVGRKCDVPRDACYVGSYHDCYVWVTRAGAPGLSRFTLAILAITGSSAKEIVDRGLTFAR